MDWIDIGLHVLIAEAVAFGAFFLTRDWLTHIPIMFWLFLLNMFVWPVREFIQHFPEPWEMFTHIQSLLEWTLPSVLGCVTIFKITPPPLLMD